MRSWMRRGTGAGLSAHRSRERGSTHADGVFHTSRATGKGSRCSLPRQRRIALRPRRRPAGVDDPPLSVDHVKSHKWPKVDDKEGAMRTIRVAPVHGREALEQGSTTEAGPAPAEGSTPDEEPACRSRRNSARATAGRPAGRRANDAARRAAARRASTRHAPARPPRALRAARLVAAFLLIAAAFLAAPGAYAQSAEDLWLEHAGSDDGAAPTIVSIHRHNAPEHTRNPDHFFRVTFSEPVANVDSGDFDALGASDEWWRVWRVDRIGLDDNDPFLKPCNEDYHRIADHLRGDARWDLLARLSAECDRRKGMSRQFVVEVGSQQIRNGRVRTVRLAMTAGQDVMDVWGNRLDPALPTGPDYQTFTVDRQPPQAVLSAEVDAHRGPGAHWTFYITIDFGEPVNGLSAGSVEVQGGYKNGGWGRRHDDGDSFYRLSIGATGTGPITVRLAAGSARDLAGNPNLAAEPLVIPYNAGAGLRMPTPPDQTFTAGIPIDAPALPAAINPYTDPTYELTGQGGGALPAWLEFDPATRRMSGTPPAPAPAVTLDYTVNVPVRNPSAAVTSRTVSFTVTVGPALHVPAPADRTFTADVPITPLTLAPAAGGTAPFSYALDGLPAGLTFDPARRRLSGTPQSAGSATVTYRATDANNAAGAATFTVTVKPSPLPGATVSETALSMTEGGSRTYTVVLNTRPGADVSIMPVAQGSGFQVRPQRAVFTPSNWDTPQTFTVSAPQDGDSDDEAGSIGHEVGTADPFYRGISIPGVAVTVVDDDTVGITVAPTTLTIPEGEARTYTVRLGSRPSADVVVYVSISGDQSDGTEFICCGSSNVPFTPESWDHPRTFTVTAPEDEDADDGTLWIEHFSLSDDPDYHRIPIATVTAYAVDDDAGAPLTLGTPPNRAYTAGRSIGTPQLPPAGGGTLSYTYGLSGQGGDALPTWLDFDPATRRMSGTPQAEAAAVTLDYTVNDGVTSLTRSFTVTVNAAPQVTAPMNQTYTAGTAIPALTLDAASGGTAPLTYTLTGLPAGLSFNGTSRRLFGTPQAAGTSTVTYRVTDANGASDSDTFTITVEAAAADTTAPTVVSVERHDGANAQDELTNADTLTFRVSFSEDVENVNAADFAATASTATATGVTGASPGATYVVTLGGGNLATFNGAVGLAFATGQNIQDLAGNALAATNPSGVNETYTLDNTAPTVTLTAPDTHDGSAAFNVTVTFSEDVTDFDDAADLTITNGALTSGAASITRNSATSYTANVTPSGTTDVTVTAAAGAAEDGAGNASAASSTETVSYTAALSLTAPADQHWTEGEESTVNDANLPAATGGTPPYTYAVSGLPPGVTYAAGGLEGAPTKRTTTGTNPVEYTATYTVTDDSGGTDNMAQAQFMITLYAEPAVAAQDDLAFTVGRPVDVTFGPVTGGYAPFDHQLLHWTTGVDVTLDGLTFDSTTGRLSGTPTTATSGALDVGHGVIDANFADSPFTRFNLTINAAPVLAAVTDQTWTVGTPVDFDLPAATGGTTPLTYTLTGTLPAGLTFNDATATDPPSITGTPTTATAATTLTYTVTDANGASPATPVTFSVTVASDDTIAPTVLRVERDDGAGNDPGQRTNADSLQFRVTFSEDVEHVDTADFNASGAGDATTVAAVTGNAAQYIVTVSGGSLGTHNGVVGLTFDTGQNIEDEADNDLVATLPTGTSYQTYTLDNTRPTVMSIERHDGTNAQAELTNANSLNFRVTFSEGVENVGQADFDASGTTGDASRIQGNIQGTTRIVTISGGNLSSRNGVVGLTFATGVTIHDLAGNALNATLPTGTSYQTYTLDTTAPTATLTAPDNHDGAAAFNVAVAFSEDVSGFDAVADVTITGGALTGGANGITSTDAQNYTLNITPTTGSTSAVTVQVPANAAADDAGNGNAASATSTVNYLAVDTTAPTVLRIERHDGTSAQDELTNADSVQFRVTFSEAVQNVDTLDFDASGAGDATAVTGSGAVYIVTVSGGDLNDYDGTVGLTFATGPDIADTAGNALTATLPTGASYQTYTLDNTAPMVLLSAEPGTHDGSSAINITFTFSEPVRGFVVNDLNVTGGATSAFTGSDNDTRYSVTLTPSGNADATVQVPANRAQDAAGNGNAVSPTRTVLYLAPGAPGISVSRTVLFVPEGGSATYTIVLTAAPTANVTVNALFNNGEDESTCDCDPDLSLRGGRSIDARHPSRNEVLTVTFTPDNWDTPQTVTVTAAHDDDADNGTDDIQHGSNSDDARYVIGGATVTAVEVDDEAGLGLIAPGNQFFTSGRAISVAALPAAVGATGMVAYALVEEGTGTLPNWLTFTAATRVMSGTPPTVTTPTTSTLAYTATDDNGTAADTSDDVTTDPATFTITVNPAPALAAPADQAWAVGTAVDLDLTKATGGTEPFTYALTGTLPAGLTFNDNADPPSITGTPTAVAAATTLTYTATDANGASPAAVTFDTAVVAAAPTGPFSWSATLRVEQSSLWVGYCFDPCPVNPSPIPGTHGSLVGDGGDQVIAVPGTGNVTVTAVDRYGNISGTGNRLVLGLSPLPAPSAYGSWTITWGERPAVALSTRSRVADNGTLEFDNFFTGETAALDGETVYVCIASAGQDCVLPDRTLSTLTLAEADGTAVAITPALAAGTTAYTASVVHDVATVTVAATATATGATVAYEPADADTNTAGHQVALTAGDDTDITVTVTNFRVTEEYTVTVTRAGLPAGCETDDIWCTEMDLSVAQVSTLGGFCGPVPNGCSGEIVGSVVDDDFVVDGTTYRVTTLVWFAGSHQTLANQLTFDLDRLPAAAVYQQWTLHIGDDEAFLADVTPTASGTFNFPGFYAASTGRTRPAAGTTVLVRLTEGTVGPPDTTAPTVVSVERHDGTDALDERTRADTLHFRVTFSETVENVTADDFAASNTTAPASGVSGSGAVYIVTVTGGDLADLNATVGLTFVAGKDIADEAGNALTATLPTGASYETYIVDNNFPTIVSIKRDDGNGNDPGEFTNADSLVFLVTFSEAVTGVGSGDFATTGVTDTNRQVAVLTSSTARVTVADVTNGDALEKFDGEVGLIFDTGQNIADADGNLLDPTLPAGANYETYTLDNTAPTPVLRASPRTHNGTRTSEVTIDFGEPVSGYDPNEVNATGGTLTGFSGSGGDSSYTVTLTPGGNADATVSVAAGVANDRAGNDSLAADDLTVAYSTTPPAVIWSSTLTVGEETPPLGTPVSSFLLGFDRGRQGSLSDTTFTVPGTSPAVEAEVFRLEWTLMGHVMFGFDKEVTAEAVAEWVLHIGDAHLYLADGVAALTSTASAWQLDNALSTLPQVGTDVAVCLTTGGAACPAIGTPDTTLSTLSLAEADGTAVTLSPAFASDTAAYTASVKNSVATVTVAADATDGGNTSVGFTPADADGTTAGHQVALAVGETTITITVTNVNTNASQEYTVVVTRAPTLVWSATLYVDQSSTYYGYCGGVNGSCNISTGVHGALNPLSFTLPGTTDTVSVNDLSTNSTFGDDELLFSLTPPSSSNPAAPVPKATYEAWTLDFNGIKLKLSEASSVSTVAANQNLLFTFSGAVPDGTRPTSGYVAVCLTTDGGDCPAAVPPPDTTLSALELTAGGSAVTLDPVFASDTTVYEAVVANSAETVTVSATPTASGATVAFSPADADGDSTNGHQVALVLGGNRITATVTNDFWTGESYTIDVTRDVPPAVLWSAQLTIGTSTDQNGFGSAYGTLSPATFDAPGNVSIEVKELQWGDMAMLLHFDTEPALPSGYETWTLHVGDDSRSLGDFDKSDTSAGANYTYRTGFFAGTAPSESPVTVCITVGGATCADAAATEPIWSATMTVADSSGGIGYSEGASGAIAGSLSPGRTFTPPTGTEAAVTRVAYYSTSNVWLTVAQLSEGALDGYVLHFGDGSGAISEATSNVRGTGYSFRWAVGTFFTGTRPADGDTGVVVCITTDTSGCGASGASGPSGTQAPSQGLQARFGPALAWHTGMPFWTELHFSAEPKLGYRDVRDKVLDISGGRIARAQRLTQGSNGGWRLLVEPDGWGDIAIALPPTTDCAAEGAVCTKAGEALAQGIDLSVPGPGDNLAARLTGHDTRHTGAAFDLELHFNRGPNVGYRDVRDRVFEVTGGRIRRARRLVQGSNQSWRLTVEPQGAGAVTLDLPPTEDCADEGAVCTRDGDRLEQGIAVTVEGPTAFSVSDAEVEEGPGSVLAFEVSLSRRLRAEARVEVATRDGTATAGADYVALAQTLVFAPGETVKTVEVTVLDDAHDEGTETLTLELSNASGAQIADAEGTGSIANSDAIPKAWLARFGRTVTGQVLDAVEDRLAAPRQASMRATLAGQALPLAADEAANDLDAAAQRAALRTLAARTGATDPSGAPAGFIDADAPLHLRGRTLSGQDVLTGTAFTLTGPAGAGDDAYVSLWGRAMVSGFNGNDDGLTLDGRVTTSLLGVDWATEGWTAGLSFGHSTGSGGYRGGDCGADGACAGVIEASLTGLYPYAGFTLSERLSLWLAAGLGAGQLTVHPHGIGALATDLAMGMGAAGLRSELLGAANGAGVRLALKGDARFTRTWSEAVNGPHGNLAAADADVWLVRAGIEGSRRFRLGAATSLIPSLEIGVRRDGGDAETGFGADVGVGLALADVQRGLRLDLRMRALAAHEAAGFRDWGASAALSFDPRPASDRGLSMTLRQVWGASPSGGMEALLRRDTLTGLAPPGAAAGRLEATLSYGVPVFGGALTGAPSAGVGVSETSRDYRLGWRLTPAAQRAVPFEVNLDATRRESALTPAADHGVMLRGRVNW